MNNKTISKHISKKPSNKSNKMKLKETLDKLSKLTKNRNRNKRENHRNNRRKQRINPTLKKKKSTISKENRNKKNPTINKNSNISRKVNKTISQTGKGIHKNINYEYKKSLQVGGAISEKIITNIKQTIKPRPEITFEEIVGYEDIKQDLREVVTKIEMSKYEDIKTQVETDSYILLYGPPGTGKTYLVSAMANFSEKSTYFLVDSGDITGELAGESQSYIKELFNLAREKVKETDGGFSLIFIDEVETILGDDLTGTAAEMHNIFLTELTAGHTKNMGLIFICATNHPSKLSPAILSRFGEKIYIGPPSYKDYEKFVDKQICLDRRACSELRNKQKVIDFCRIRNFMPRDIYQLCKIAKAQILNNFIKGPSYRITPDNNYAACNYSDPRSIHSILNSNSKLKRQYFQLKFPNISDDEYSKKLEDLNVIFTVVDIPPSQDTKSNYQLEKINDQHFLVAMEKKNKASSQIGLNEPQYKTMFTFIDNNASDKEKINIRKQKAGKYYYTKEHQEDFKIDQTYIDTRIGKIEELYKKIEEKLNSNQKQNMDYEIETNTIEIYAEQIGAISPDEAADLQQQRQQQRAAATNTAPTGADRVAAEAAAKIEAEKVAAEAAAQAQVATATPSTEAAQKAEAEAAARTTPSTGATEMVATDSLSSVPEITKEIIEGIKKISNTASDIPINKFLTDKGLGDKYIADMLEISQDDDGKPKYTYGVYHKDADGTSTGKPIITI